MDLFDKGTPSNQGPAATGLPVSPAGQLAEENVQVTEDLIGPPPTQAPPATETKPKKRKRGRPRKNSSSKSKAVQPASVKPPPQAPTLPDTPSVPPPMMGGNSDAFALQFVSGLTTISLVLCGKLSPAEGPIPAEPSENEQKALYGQAKAYAEATGATGFPPIVALGLCTMGFLLPRIRSNPTARERINGWIAGAWGWLKGKFGA